MESHVPSMVLPRIAIAVALVAGCTGGNGARDAGRSSGGATHCFGFAGACHCDMDLHDGGLDRCDETSVGEHGVCCRSASGTDCRCEPVTCGINSSGNCACGSLLPPFTGGRTSCDGTATTCCTQDSHYCYCEDGCERRFGNRIVDSCDVFTMTASCDVDEDPVSSCQ